MLAGLNVADSYVIELAQLLRGVGCEATAARLETGYDHQAKLLSLSVDCPDGLGELRAVLVQEHQWRQREGLG
jgi:hypothetical protein